MKRIKLLIVDDSPDSVREFLNGLRERGYDPLVEEEPEENERFPSHCPNPILRVDRYGILRYANKKGSLLAEQWGSRIGERLPSPWPKLVESSLEKNATLKTEVRNETDAFLFAVIPVVAELSVYLLGLDITANEAFRSLREDMLSTVSRELAAPLTLAQSAIANLKTTSSMDATFQTKMMNVLERNIRRMSLLVSDMTDLLKRTSETENDDSAIDRILSERKY